MRSNNLRWTGNKPLTEPTQTAGQTNSVIQQLHGLFIGDKLGVDVEVPSRDVVERLNEKHSANDVSNQFPKSVSPHNMHKFVGKQCLAFLVVEGFEELAWNENERPDNPARHRSLNLVGLHHFDASSNSRFLA